MKRLLILVGLVSSVTVMGDVINLPSTVYLGKLFHNQKSMGSNCYLKITEVTPDPAKGKHCNALATQLELGLDRSGVHPNEMRIDLSSRKTNYNSEQHLPVTCGEVVMNVARPWEIDRWGDDTTYLFNQVFSAQYKVNRHDNHYIVIFNGVSKEPSRAMLHRVTWLREDIYECRELSPQ